MTHPRSEPSDPRGTVERLYPEHAKLHKVKERSQAIGEFLEFGPWTLCEWREGVGGWEGSYQPVRGGIQAALATYFGIDQEKLDQEKRGMLDQLRREAQD